MRTLFIILMLFINNLHGQSPFEFLILSSNNKVMEVKYDGNLYSVADSDTTMLKPFKFVSVGNLKSSFAIADGSIYTKFLYRSKQIVIIESNSKTNIKSESWKSVEHIEIERFLTKVNKKDFGKNRISCSIQLSDCKIYLINIKTKKVDFFKWMLGQIEFT